MYFTSFAESDIFVSIKESHYTNTYCIITMNAMLKTLLLFFFLVIFFSPLAAQSEQCLDFELLPVNVSYGSSSNLDPGDALISQNGISVTVEEFKLTMSSVSFGNATIKNDSISVGAGGLDNKYLLVEDINLQFNFGALEVNSLSFDFIELSPQINIAVNGQPIQIFFSFFGMPTEVAEGVELLVELDEDTNLPTGSVKLYGRIKSFLIGGEKLALDNLCAHIGPLTDCLEFENLPADSIFGRDNGLLAGDTLLLESGVAVTLDSFTYLNNSGDFWNVRTTTNAFGTLPGVFNGQFLFVSNINLNFDFRQLPFPTSSVSFTFMDGGGEENISVNGEPIRVLNMLSEAPTEIAPGVTMTIAANPFTTLPAGIVTLTGTIESLVIGGQEFGLDHICYTLEPVFPTCAIDSLVIQVGECTPSGTLSLNLNFDYQLPNNDLFDIYYHDSLLTTAALNNLPFSLEGFQSLLQHGGRDSITICINDQADCCATVYFDVPDCTPDDSCVIDSLQTTLLPGNSVGTFFVKLDVFDHASPTDSFFVQANGAILGRFSYREEEIILGPFRSDEFLELGIQVVDAANLECTAWTLVDFSGLYECTISEIEAEASDCYDGNKFDLKIDFEVEALLSDSFTVAYRGATLGTFPLSALPITLQGFTAIPTDSLDRLYICLNGNPNCCTPIIFNTPNCTPGQDCSITALRAEATDCDRAGKFYVRLKVDAERGSEHGFQVFLDNVAVDSIFHYTSEPIVIGPFAASDEARPFTLTVQDVVDSTCVAQTHFNSPVCGGSECAITVLRAEAFGCDEIGDFYIRLAVVAENAGTEGFIVYVNGAAVDSTFQYTNTGSIVIGPFDSHAAREFDIKVRDKEFPSCFAVKTIDAPNCVEDECILVNPRVNVTDCRPDGTFDVTLNFTLSVLSNIGLFDVYYQGELVGSFGLLDLPVRLENLRGNTNDADDYLKICLNLPLLDCCKRVEFDAPDCEVGNCEITKVIAEAHDCDENGDFMVDLQVRTAFLGSEGFQVYVNRELIDSTFSYDSTFITIGPFTSHVDRPYEFKVQDIEHPDCHKTARIEAVNCNDECKIEDIKIENRECDADGNFLLDLEVHAEHEGAQGFIVLVNGQEIDSVFSYDAAFITIGPFAGDGETAYEIKVRDVEYPDCYKTKRVSPMNCQRNECILQSIRVDASDCHSDGTFDLTVNFTTSILVNTGLFDVYYRGEVVGSFSLLDLPVLIPNLRPHGGDNASVKICLNLPLVNCCQEVEVDVPNCDDNNGCALEEVHAQATTCRPDGTFDVLVHVVTNNTASDSFAIHYRNQLVGTFSLHDSIAVISNFGQYLGNGNNRRVNIRVSIIDGVPCSRVANVDLPNCEPQETCVIQELRVEADDCDGQGMVMLNLKVRAEHEESEEFIVLINGQEYIRFPYGESHYPVGPLAADTIYRVTVQDTNNADCAKTITVGPIDCNDASDCSIRQPILRATDCRPNGTFDLKVDFTTSILVNTALFKVYYHGEVVGEFNLLHLPLTLENLHLTGHDDDKIKICFLEPLLDCCTTLEFDAPDCAEEQCTLEGVTAETSECTASGAFYVTLHIQSDSAAVDSFLIRGNGQEYGIYASHQREVVLGPFSGNRRAYEFIVKSLFNPDCYKQVEVRAPDCDAEDSCTISNLVVEAGDCRRDGTFPITIDFDVEHADSRFFSIYYGDRWLGSRPIANLPVTIPNFLGSSGGTEEITVCISGQPNCCATVTFEAPNCGEDDCRIREAEVMRQSCVGEQFFVDLRVDAVNTGNSGYKVTVNGQVLGEFEYDEEYITLGPFTGDGQTIYAIIIQDNDYPYCSFVVPIGPVDCVAECNIHDLTAVPSECETDSTFALIINFSVDNPIGPGFVVYANGVNVGEFPYANLPITIASFQSDEGRVEITVQANDYEACSATTTFEVPNCDDDEVWPGDTDNSNQANHIDLLNIGLAFGAEGAARMDVDATIEWRGVRAQNWTGYFPNGLNYKFADANGDGIVNEADVNVILQNYGREHGPVDSIPLVVGTDEDPILLVDLPESGELPNGTAFTVPIVLGQQGQLAQEVYGIAFTIEFDPEVINPESISVDVPSSWMGRLNDNLITIQKVYPEAGIAHIAISRTDHRSISGYGTVALFSGIIDDILGHHQMRIEVKDIHAINDKSKIIPIRTSVSTVGISSTPTSTKEVDDYNSIKVFPNPTDGTLELYNQMQTPIEQVELFHTNGQLIRRIQQPGNQLSLHDLKAGVYMLRIQVGDQTYLRRVVKL